MLAALAGVDDKFYVEVASERASVRPDPRNTARDRTTAVHYVKFPLSEAAVSAIKKRAPTRIGVDHPAYGARAELPAPLVATLADELES